MPSEQWQRRRLRKWPIVWPLLYNVAPPGPPIPPYLRGGSAGGGCWIPPSPQARCPIDTYPPFERNPAAPSIECSHVCRVFPLADCELTMTFLNEMHARSPEKKNAHHCIPFACMELGVCGGLECIETGEHIPFIDVCHTAHIGSLRNWTRPRTCCE